MKKTKMKIMSLLLSMVLFLFVPFLNIQAASNHPVRLVDQAELLTAEEQQQIQAKLDEVSELHHCDAVVMTVNSLEGKTATEYADDAFDYDGYGLGEDKAGYFSWWIWATATGQQAHMVMRSRHLRMPDLVI